MLRLMGMLRAWEGENEKLQARGRAANRYGRLLPIGGLLLVLLWMGLIVRAMRGSGDYSVAAVVGLLGLMNIALHKQIGTRFYAIARKSSAFWERTGEVSTRRLYLDLGVILVLGAFLLFLTA
jgi:hypothetical protein